MNYRNVTETLLNVARQYEQDVKEAFRYYQSQNFNARMHSNGLNVDARDFIPMVVLMGIKGDTQEERAEDIHAKMEELASAFEDPDHSKRDDYLDLIYYLVDDFGSTFDPASMNMNDPTQVGKLLQSMLIEQTVAMKKLENPEYIQKRYPTSQDRTLHDAHDHFRMAVGAAVMGNLEKNGINLHQIGLSLPRALPEQERLHLQQYSWIRRTLFNWGPFRIEPLQEKLDRIVNDPDAEERLARVTAEQKTRIEAGIKRKAEKEIQAKLELERDDARRDAFEKEAKKLDDSTAQWDENSVIGILGQQIAGTWKTNNGPVDGVCRAIRTDLAMTSASKRYATIAIPLAKMVLYSQLCSDRAANNGEPGEIEKRLGMGDAKTIAERIHNTAVKMAEDPMLKNLFQDKVGVLTGKEICPDSVEFEKIMANGGVDRFRMEYMKKLQEMANQKEQQAPANELEMENQKQQEMQKDPM